jgi:hypothetical protein
MSKRTFILRCEEMAENDDNNDDIINLLTVRVLETYLLDVSQTEIPFDTVGSLRKLVSERVKISSDLKMYTVEIDFENDIVV